MNWPLAFAMLVAIPFGAGVFHLLTGWFSPLAGYALGLMLYWVLIGALSLRALAPTTRAALIAHTRPPRLLAFLAFLPVVVFAWIALASLEGSGFPPALLLVVAVFALVNGMLEEVFWRGALIPAPDREAVVVSWALFTAWHVVFLFAREVDSIGGGAGMIIGAAVMGAIWLALRLKTGVLGPGIAAHVGFNLFLFADLAARNWPAHQGPGFMSL